METTTLGLPLAPGSSPAPRPVLDTGKLLAPLDDLRFPSIDKVTRVRAANRNALLVSDEMRAVAKERAMTDVEKFDFNARFLDHCLRDLTAAEIRELTFEESEIAVGYALRRYEEIITAMRAAEAAVAGAGAEGNAPGAATPTGTPSPSATGTRRSRSAPSSPDGSTAVSAT